MTVILDAADADADDGNVDEIDDNERYYEARNSEKNYKKKKLNGEIFDNKCAIVAMMITGSCRCSVQQVFSIIFFFSSIGYDLFDDKKKNWMMMMMIRE